MKGLIAAHSGLRYIVLALLVIAIVNAIVNMKKGNYLKKDKMINLFAMIFIHIQLVLGLVLYFIGPRVNFSSWIQGVENTHFFAVEHALMMILAVVFITLGRKKAEKQAVSSNKHKMILRYYGLGLILIFIAIPWPFLYPDLEIGLF
jgi:carbon starvation protein CstA